VPGEEERWAAYAAAEVRIMAAEGCVRVLPAPPGRVTGTFPDPAGRTIYVITACNPGGLLLDGAANRSAQARLEAEFGGGHVTVWRAAGGDRAWRHVEPSVAVLGIDLPEALELGRKYGQDAIFALTPRALQVVECETAAEKVVNGWVIETIENSP